MNKTDALKISADGYRKLYNKYKYLLNSLDARIVDENKLLFAKVEFLKRLRDDVSAYLIDDGEPDNKNGADKTRPGEFDDNAISGEKDPYKAILMIIDAVLEFKYYPEKQPGLVKIKNRFPDPTEEPEDNTPPVKLVNRRTKLHTLE